jgi:phi LC3 family holin
MKKIDWKARLKNKVWLASMVSAVVLAAQGILPFFDIEFDGGRVLDVFNGLLALLVGLGVIIDPTSDGIGD